MMMTQNGKLLYISDNAAEYLGHSMVSISWYHVHSYILQSILLFHKFFIWFYHFLPQMTELETLDFANGGQSYL